MDDAKPWNTVIRESTDNLEFWTNELQELALLYSAARGEEAPSWTHQQRELLGKKGGGKYGKDDKGGHPRKVRGAYITNQYGQELCHRFNKDGCVHHCARAHQCPHCLGPHRLSECPRASTKIKGKGGGKGKGKDRETATGSDS